jgi:hypothetical protein
MCHRPPLRRGGFHLLFILMARCRKANHSCSMFQGQRFRRADKLGKVRSLRKPASCVLVIPFVFSLVASQMDEPIADPSAIATYLICRCMEEVAVLLTGMADELLLGTPGTGCIPLPTISGLCPQACGKSRRLFPLVILERLCHEGPYRGIVTGSTTPGDSRAFRLSAAHPG